MARTNPRFTKEYLIKKLGSVEAYNAYTKQRNEKARAARIAKAGGLEAYKQALAEAGAKGGKRQVPKGGLRKKARIEQ